MTSRSAARLLLVGCILCGPGCAAHLSPKPVPGLELQSSAHPFSHERFTRLLERISPAGGGRVDYAMLAGEEAAELDAYLLDVAAAEPDRWSRVDQLAFWINAANAGMLKLALERRSRDSVEPSHLLEAGAPTWSTSVLHANGRWWTPDELRAFIVRGFDEPRAHFALFLAARGGPALRAFQPEMLDLQLDAAVRAYLDRPDVASPDSDTRTLRLSAFFDWYGADLSDDPGTPLPVRLAELHPRLAAVAGYRIEYTAFDWRIGAGPSRR